jgi:hypothetical protein
MGMNIEFFAVPPGSRVEADSSAVESAHAEQVATISINSRAVEAVFSSLGATLLAPLVGDASQPYRMALILAADLGLLLGDATSLRARPPADAALVDLAEAIQEAVAEAESRTADLLVVAR